MVVSRFSSCSESSEICACDSSALEIVQPPTISDRLSTVMDEEPYDESKRSSAVENLSPGSVVSVIVSLGSTDFRIERYESMPESMRFSSRDASFLQLSLAMAVLALLLQAGCREFTSCSSVLSPFGARQSDRGIARRHLKKLALLCETKGKRCCVSCH